MLEFVLIFGVIILIAVVIVVAWYMDKKRTEALEELSSEMGFDFSKDGGSFPLPEVSCFELFSHGHSRKFKNAMTGVANDIAITIGDYRYTTGGGKNQTTLNQTVVIFQSDMLNLTSFTLKPENILHKIGSAFGYQDIDFDSNPQFSDSFILRGDDEATVRELFTENVLEFFAGKKEVSAEGAGNKLIYYRAGKKCGVEQIKSFLEEGFVLFNLFAGLQKTP